ncbi:hypothetical protein ABU614_04325 [Lysobacter firmicutimachus]|uniref:Uncharacterized protein n=1 Tax=Lysobacter firmicutimachus TaxID=1792846 RepID=A0AAU8MVL3_9GAMM
MAGRKRPTGDYIADVARAYLDRATVEFENHAVTGKGDIDDLDAIRQSPCHAPRADEACRVRRRHVIGARCTQNIAVAGAGHTYEEAARFCAAPTSARQPGDAQVRRRAYTYFVPRRPT